uniref:Neurotransmitter-gated ion-channel ligand-binding domain-containing protein n=1 Tax=Sinocyclocheilus anshuiensis TaxID=1608454 RepID=A0A671QC70_9TELE
GLGSAETNGLKSTETNGLWITRPRSTETNGLGFAGLGSTETNGLGSLSWDPVKCGTDRISIPRKQLWRPDIIINEFIDENKVPDTYYLYVEYTGKVMDDLPFHVISSCNLDIYTFPFDIQNCTFTFNSYHFLFLLSKATQHGLAPFAAFSRGQGLSGFVMSQTREVTRCCSYKRRATLYVVNLLIPSCFLITVDLFSFLLPPQNVDRSAFKMTLILGYTVFLLLMNDLLPVTGNTLPLINAFFSLCLALMVASLLETILIINIQCGSTHYGPLPQWAKALFLNYIAKLNTFISTSSLVPVEHRTDTKRCDPAFETPQREAVHKTPALVEMKKISHELLSIRQQIDKHLKTDESTEEWMHLGQVIDRLLFCLYIVFLSVSFITILVFWLYWYKKNDKM